MINIDYSVILQALSLLVFFFFLRKVLFRPLKELLEKREARIETAERLAEVARRRSLEIEDEITRQTQDATLKGSARERELVESALQAANAITSRERAEADRELKQHALVLEQNERALRNELADQARTFGAELAKLIAAPAASRRSGGQR